MRPSDAARLAATTNLLFELRARLGAASLPLIERWDIDVISVGRLDSTGVARLVFVALSPWARDRYDVTLEPGPGHFPAMDVEGVERLARRHLGVGSIVTDPATAA